MQNIFSTSSFQATLKIAIELRLQIYKVLIFTRFIHLFIYITWSAVHFRSWSPSWSPLPSPSLLSSPNYYASVPAHHPPLPPQSAVPWVKCPQCCICVGGDQLCLLPPCVGGEHRQGWPYHWYSEHKLLVQVAGDLLLLAGTGEMREWIAGSSGIKLSDTFTQHLHSVELSLYWAVLDCAGDRCSCPDRYEESWPARVCTCMDY